MINIEDLPAVRAQLEHDAAALKARDKQTVQDMTKKSVPEFARAPVSSGSQSTSLRPPAVQRSAR